MMADVSVGAALLARHAATVLAGLLLLSVWVGVGALVRRRLSGAAALSSPTDARPRLVLDAALGAATVALVLLAMGGAGLLTRAAVLAVTAALGLAGSRSTVRAWSEWLGVVRPAWKHWRQSAPAGMAALFLLLLLAAAVAPPTEWDSLTYHLRIPLQFLDAGRVMLPRDSFHVSLVGAAQLATLPLLAAGLLAGPSVMQVFALALVLLATLELARAAGLKRASRWVAVATLVGCPVVMLTAISARVDVMLMLAVAAAHLALLRARQGEPRLTLAGALLVGLALATKPIAGAYAIALVPLGYRAAGGPRRALALVLAAALVAAPWYLKNQWLVGAPLYPLGGAPRFEPWLAEVFGSTGYPASLDASILRALPESREEFNLLDAFVAPGRLTIESEGTLYRLSPLLVLVALLPLYFRSRRVALEMAVVGAVYAALIIVPFGRINLRYLMPALPALAIGAAAVTEALVANARDRRREALGLIIAIVAALPLAPALRSRFGGDAVLLRHAAGMLPAREVWRRHPDPAARVFAPAVERLQRQVPRDARVLLLWEARALPLQRDAVADIMLSNWPFLSQSPAIAGCLATTGITHVVVNHGAVRHYLRRGADSTAFRLGSLDEFRRRCARGRFDLGSDFELLVLGAAP